MSVDPVAGRAASGAVEDGPASFRRHGEAFHRGWLGCMGLRGLHKPAGDQQAEHSCKDPGNGWGHAFSMPLSGRRLQRSEKKRCDDRGLPAEGEC